MNEHIQFLQSFLKNPLKVGSVTPSSDELAMEMVVGVEPNENNAVIEIGCGTGAITKYLAKVVSNRKSFIGIEIEKDFVRKLNRDYPQLNVVCENASKISEILRNNEIGKVSYIISGLPFVILPEKVSDDILREIDKLMANGCMFRTFQYAHGYNLPIARKFRQRMDEKYGKVKRSPLILKNVPPAYVLTWNTL
ncbi:MAG: methyltransferase domain-containing protein [Pyrinomonadaceae bacterium]|nr:methyltransferase domain-containing protein [Pyrinomonadaceae bacterium]